MKDIDRILREHVSVPLSLSPDRKEITSLQRLSERLITSTHCEKLLVSIAFGLRQIVEAQIKHFPENIFWDMDYLVAFLFAQNEPEFVEVLCGKIAGLQASFGMHSEIRFQYAHDFTYGFDWSRWVAKNPEKRANTGPYGLEFLLYLEKREVELLELIKENDEKYHKLKGDKPRNPFVFSRDPPAEKQLHEELATRGLIPVPAWEINGPSVWDKDFTRLREDISLEIFHVSKS